MCCSSELRGVGTLYGTGTRLIGSRTINVIICLDHPTALAENIEVIVRGVVTRCDVNPVTITTQLTHGFHTSCPFINDLHEVEVTVSDNGESYFHPISHSELLSRRQDFTDDFDAATAILNLARLLVELCIDRTPRGSFRGLLHGEGLALRRCHGLYISETCCGLRVVEDSCIHLHHREWLSKI